MSSVALTGDMEKFAEVSPREASTLYGSLLAAHPQGLMKNLLITSGIAGEGKTASAVRAAYAIASQTNSEILLVDFNLQRPKLSESYGLQDAEGLSDLIRHDRAVSQLVRPTERKNLFVLSAGQSMHPTLDLLVPDSFQAAMKHISESFGVVIWDGASIMGTSDISLVARYFEGILLVVEAEKTKWDLVEQAKKKIEDAQGRLLGTTLNRRKFYLPKFLYGKV